MEPTSRATSAHDPIRAVRRVTAYYLEHRISALRIALGVVYVWFGVLKFFGGTSPAAQLATDTMSAMTFHTVSASVSRPLLALMETLIGLGFLSGRLRRLTGVVFLVQVFGAMSSLVLAHQDVWSHPPIVPTMDGQYVIKDLVLLTAGIVVLTAPQRARATAPVAAPVAVPMAATITVEIPQSSMTTTTTNNRRTLPVPETE